MRLFQTMVFFCSLLPSLGMTADDSVWYTVIRQSQIDLARAEPDKAEAALVDLENNQPDIRKQPLFCYQRFFVALEGRGDRATAKLMLQRLDALVEAGALPADSPIYLSVTEAWHRALFSTDSDLIRLANRKMADRLASTPNVTQ